MKKLLLALLGTLLLPSVAWAQSGCPAYSSVAKVVSTATYKLSGADRCAMLLVMTGGAVVTVPPVGTNGELVDGYVVKIFNASNSIVTLSGMVNGVTNPTIPKSYASDLYAGNSNWYATFTSTNPITNGGGSPSAGVLNDIQLADGSGGFNALTPGTGIETWITTPTSANLAAAMTDETGSGPAVFGTGPSITGLKLPDLGGSGTRCVHTDNTGLLGIAVADCGSGGGGSPAGADGDIQIKNGSVFGSLTPGLNVSTWITTPNSANLRAALTDETGSGSAVFAIGPTLTSPILTSPNLGTPSVLHLNNADLLSLTTGTTGTLLEPHGGTGQTTYSNGQVLIGNTSTGGLAKSTITGGANITVTNGPGTITISSSGATAAAGGISGQGQWNNATALDGFDWGTGLNLNTTTKVLNLQSVTADHTSANYTILTGDANKTLLVGVHTYTLAQAGTTGFGPAWGVCLLNTSNGTATLNTSTSSFLGASNSTTLSLPAGAWACPTSDGTNYPTLLSAGMTGPASSTNGNIAVFNGTTGRILADGGKALPTGAILGDSDTQTVANKTIDCTLNLCSNYLYPAPYGWASKTNPDKNVIYTVGPGHSATVLDITGRVATGVGTSAAVVIYKAPSGTICSSGVAQHSGAFDANSSPATNQTLTLVGGAANDLAAGDSLCVSTADGTAFTAGSGNAGMTVLLEIHG